MMDENDAGQRAQIAALLHTEFRGSVSDSLIRDIIRWTNDRSQPMPIATAPADDGWILGDVSTDERSAASRHPWVIVTRSDEGWADAEGYVWHPTRWLPLPDPQPQPSGWRPAEGEVRVGYWGGGFAVYVRLPNGDQDEWRDFYPCHTLAKAKERAADWAAKINLPWFIDPEAQDAPDGPDPIEAIARRLAQPRLGQ